ncbi:MAG: cytochrome c oxidase subunit II [Acidimicrobiales bacterium]
MTSTTEDTGGASPAETHLTMGIDPIERNWMRVSIALLVAFAGIVTIAGFTMGFTVPGADEEVDPTEFVNSAPWNEPGLREIGDNEYEAYVIAQAWSFAPRELVVPLGATVTIYVSSPDLQHGFKITDTNINMQIVPGQVSTLKHTFDELGEFNYICTEYCGTGHAQMYGTVKVVAELPDEAAATTEGEDGQ